MKWLAALLSKVFPKPQPKFQAYQTKCAGCGRKFMVKGDFSRCPHCGS